MSIKPEFIIVDGNYFRPYKNIDYETIKSGDNKYRNITAVSILAKTYRDEYIEQLVSDYPEYEKYGWGKNMGYCTKEHRDYKCCRGRGYSNTIAHPLLQNIIIIIRLPKLLSGKIL